MREGIEIHRPFPTGNMLRRLIFALRLYPYLKRWLREKNVDIIYNLGYVPTIPATYAAARYDIPAVTMLSHLCGRKWFKLANPFGALLNYFMEIFTIRLGKHSVLVVQCQDSARKVAQLTKAEIRVICNTFLQPNDIREARENTDVKSVRQALGIAGGELFLLLVGALIRTKNAAALVRTLAKLKTRFTLALVGDGPERAKIERLVKQLKLEEKVILLGQRPHSETLALIRACDALLLPSICEQVPNVVLEALALGRPVIATKVGGVPEIKSANLRLIDHLDEIGMILDGGIEAKKEIGAIMEEYSLDRVTREYENLFTQLANSGTKTERAQP
jgi:glycosyltransferase involved in cell wall biosynthesis